MCISGGLTAHSATSELTDAGMMMMMMVVVRVTILMAVPLTNLTAVCNYYKDLQQTVNYCINIL